MREDLETINAQIQSLLNKRDRHRCSLRLVIDKNGGKTKEEPTTRHKDLK